jgi:hypothetical protein
MPLLYVHVERSPEKQKEFEDWQLIKNLLLLGFLAIAILAGYLTSLFLDHLISFGVGFGLLLVGAWFLYPLSERIHARLKKKHRLP